MQWKWIYYKNALEINSLKKMHWKWVYYKNALEMFLFKKALEISLQ